ncbi:MAG: hypothetical protein ABL986_22185 [Vicinamibacterales bacterium]
MRLVAEPLRSLVEVDAAFDELVSETVEQLVAIGDLVERRVVSDAAQLVFLGMPRFVKLSEHSALLLGARPDGTPILDEELMPFVELESGARFLRLPDDALETVESALSGQGLAQLSREQWSHPPRVEDVEQYLQDLARRAKAGVRAGIIDEAQVFDPSTRPSYYRGRWTTFQGVDDGIVLLRRPQAYGADRWSVGWAANAIIETLVDLPIDAKSRACDEAWRIMAALDRTRNQPLPARALPAARGRVTIDLFSPPPAWLHRQLVTLGYPVVRGRGALVSYSIREETQEHLRGLLTDIMWVKWIQQEGEQDGI